MIGGTVVALFAGLDAESAVGYQAFMPLFALLVISLLFAFGFRAVFQIERQLPRDRKSTRLNSSHLRLSRMPSSA